jgi:drug/metabolite transporter (DMT)-like permease
MAALLALAAALCYGISDFEAGVASRRFAPGGVTLVAQVLGLTAACIAMAFFPGAGPTRSALAWGALSGVGSAGGTLALYYGLAAARMSVVATISAVLTAVIPAVVGLVLGEHLGAAALVGIVIAVPAIAMVSWQAPATRTRSSRAGVLYGTLAGAGFALLFIALDRAGHHAGAWPLVPGQAICVMLVLPFAKRTVTGRPDRTTIWLMLGAGVLGGSANLLFLAAAQRGQLTIVAVLSALYPAITVVLARVALHEHWTKAQIAGLLVAAAAVGLVTS